MFNNISIDIIIIIVFSINVASVIGNFKAVPKQAHCIDFLFNNVLVTPIVVIPKTISVIIKAIFTLKRINNIKPCNPSNQSGLFSIKL